ncbi:MAG: YHYH domain-containing protein [Mesorhizobium sp.]|nr:YHYH domain-containing protein [Mesorhizobium sp.]RWN47384.1 MAG: YHYH domain-containing protein [Mesorhizobium sp.]
MKKAIFAAFAVFAVAFSTCAFAHGGGTDANGCHTNHKTGEYHCH